MPIEDKTSITLAIIAGIRAQFIKLAAIQRAIKDWNNSSTHPFNAISINSGQHYDDDLAGMFIRELNIGFDYDLTNKYQDKRPICLLGQMIPNLYDVLSQIKRPIDWVIVFGDANTTMAGAIAASKLGLPVIHVEAGLRTGDRKSPEEINRIVADHLAIIHFVSSKHDISNLLSEGLSSNVVWTGDLIGDFVENLASELHPNPFGYSAGEYVLASIHREENLSSDSILKNLMIFLSGYSKRVVFIAHPRTRSRFKELGFYNLKNIDYIDTLSYKETLATIMDCAFLVTDSGAFQRESYYLGKRCLIRQDHPFWPSLVEAGVHKVVSGDRANILQGFRWIENALQSEQYPKIDDLGNGNAGRRILETIVRLSKRSYI